MDQVRCIPFELYTQKQLSFWVMVMVVVVVAVAVVQ